MRITLPTDWRLTLTPAPALTVSEWCDRNYYMAGGVSDRPQMWDTARTPYLREPLDSFIDPTVNMIVFIGPSRVGKTELLNCIIGYSAVNRPLPILYAQPEQGDVKDELTGRIKSIFENSKSPSLRRCVPETEDWATERQVKLTTLTIRGAWATNPGTMKRVTVATILFDEIDNTDKDFGRLGNTLDFVLERSTTYGARRKAVIDTTPRFEHYSGWQALLTSDYRKPFVPCPLCGHYQVLELPRIRLRPGHEGERDPETIRQGQLGMYRCAGCEELLDYHTHHRWMVDRTVWVPKTQTIAEPLPVRDEATVAAAKACGPAGWQPWRPRMNGSPPVTSRRGYWINALYSTLAGRNWSDILARFMWCGRDRERLRVFNNSWLALPHRDALERTDIAALRLKRVASYERDTVPPGALVLLAGADVHGEAKDIRYVIRAWGAYERSWLIREDRCRTFEELYEICFRTGFPMTAENGEKVLMRCSAVLVDSGHRTDEVYQFARLPGVMACKGVGSVPAYRTRPTKVDQWVNGGMQPLVIHLVNVDYFKTHIVRLASVGWMGEGAQAWNTQMAGYWHLHRDTTEEYLQEFCAEEQRREQVGTAKRRRWEYVWRKRIDGGENHFFDCEVYCAALADLMQVPLLREHSKRVGVMGEQKAQAAPMQAKVTLPGSFQGSSQRVISVGPRPPGGNRDG